MVLFLRLNFHLTVQEHQRVALADQIIAAVLGARNVVNHLVACRDVLVSDQVLEEIRAVHGNNLVVLGLHELVARLLEACLAYFFGLFRVNVIDGYVRLIVLRLNVVFVYPDVKDGLVTVNGSTEDLDRLRELNAVLDVQLPRGIEVHICRLHWVWNY